MKVSEMFPSKYLRAADIPAGREVPVRINFLEMVPVEGEDELKPCLFFENAKKGLVLNKTNATAIAMAFGDDADQWHGKTIAVFATTTMFGGKIVPCIRVRVPAPFAPPAPTQATADEIPF